jgi:hypothetical protein
MTGKGHQRNIKIVKDKSLYSQQVVPIFDGRGVIVKLFVCSLKVRPERSNARGLSRPFSFSKKGEAIRKEEKIRCEDCF